MRGAERAEILRNPFKRLFGDKVNKKSFARLAAAIASSNQYNYPDNYASFVVLQNIHIWVYRCVSVISNSFVRMEPKQYRYYQKNRIEKRELLPDTHPAQKLLLDPNPWDTTRDLLERLSVSQELTGMYVFHFDKYKNELNHLRSDRCKIIPSETEYIAGVEYSINNNTIFFPFSELLMGKFYNPNDDYYGLSPVKAATNSINAHLTAQRWNLNFFKNAATPLGLVKIDSDYYADKDDIEGLRSEIEKLYQGYEKYGKVAVGQGWSFEPITPTHRDMQFNLLMNQARDEITSAFGVPPIFLNDQEKANYANLRQYERVLWRNNIIPKALKVQSSFNKFVNPQYAQKGETIKLIFDLTQIEALREDIQKEAESSRILVTSGQLTINEARESRGLPPIVIGAGAGDTSLVPISFSRLDQLGAVLYPGDKSHKAKGEHSEIIRESILPTKEKRLIHWVTTKGIVTKKETLFKNSFIKVLHLLEKDMQENLNQFKTAKGAENLVSDSIIFDLNTGKTLMEKFSEPIYADTLETGGVRGMATAGVGISFDVSDPRVVEILQRRVQRFKDRVTERVWTTIKNDLTDGINAGEPIKDLSKRVTKSIEREINNAPTVARTEVLPSYHAGQKEGWKQSGVVEGKEWLSAFAQYSREEHMDSDGQKVGLNSAFLVAGESLEYPGDPAGTAENIINCLCDMLPVLVGEPIE